jgi:TrmH family RNA methyltransferase
LRRLSGRRKARLDAGAFVVEGPVAVREALEAAAPIRDVFVDAGAALIARHDASTGVARVLAAAEAAGVSVHHLAEGVLAAVTDTVTPQGVVAVAERRPADVASFAVSPGPVVVLAGVTDPGNAGTVIRSAEAAGAAGVLFCADAVDPFGPKTVRAAAGSVFRVPVAEVPAGAATVAALLALHGAGRSLVGTVSAGGPAPEDLDLTEAMALVLGSEAHGLPVEVRPMLDRSVTIPMAGSIESLNVAVAASVVLFEAARQARATR